MVRSEDGEEEKGGSTGSRERATAWRWRWFPAAHGEADARSLVARTMQGCARGTRCPARSRAKQGGGATGLVRPLGVRVPFGSVPRRERRQQAAAWRACTLAVLPFAAASWRGTRLATASWAGPLLGRGGAPGKSGKFLFLFSFSISDICFVSKRNVKTLP